MHRHVIPILLAAALAAAGLAAHAQDSAALEQAFQSPPDEARPWVYWFWMNGNITREGITRDLEAMEQAGIGGCLIMHVKLGAIGAMDLGEMPPDGPVTFMSEEFQQLFTYAASEANRLGLTLDMNNADGFTGSGGPWIPVEKSMKQLVWTEQHVQGGQQVTVKLPQPETLMDYFGDVAVVAYPRQPDLRRQMRKANTTIGAPIPSFNAEALAAATKAIPLWKHQHEGEPQVTLSFSEPYPADTLILHGLQQNGGTRVATLEASEDGEQWETIGEITTRWYPAVPTNTVRFDKRSARYYRITFPSNARAVSLRDIELGVSNDVHYWEPKAGYTRFGEWGRSSYLYEEQQLGETAPPQGADGIAPGQVHDLTAKLQADGALEWTPPEGEWTILRVGFTTTGIKNHPASEGGHGLECDKLDPAGAEAAFAGMLAKLVEQAGEDVGKSFNFAHIDSWEVGIQNWTERMPQAFRERNGYALTQWLPLLVRGHAIEDSLTSERFLWDYRRTLLDMIGENYLGRIESLCEQAGLNFSSEAAGRQQFLHQPLDLLAISDLPMGEFWPHEGSPREDGKAAASVAHLYSLPRVGAEAFTGAASLGAWKMHPYTLKAIGDEAFTLGITQYIIHYYVHQAYEGFDPGFVMGPWGIHLDRMNTWWPQAHAWFDYITRCQHLLRQGQLVADVLYFPGEQVPHHFGKREDLGLPLPGGYDFTGCNRESLLERLRVEDGMLVLPNGARHRYLLLADSPWMTADVALRLEELVQAGAQVLGPKPEGSPSLRHQPRADETVQRVAAALWDSGQVRWGKSFEAYAQDDGLAPDFAFEATNQEAKIGYIHRSTDIGDIYFVANHHDEAVQGEAVFRAEGQPELWHPEEGAVRAMPQLQKLPDGRTLIPLRFGPLESYFIVFRTESGKGTRGAVQNFPNFQEVRQVTGPWRISFDGPGDMQDITLDTLLPLNAHDDFDVKHFAGIATYRKAFDWKPAGDSERLYLDLGDVAVMAEVVLNGEKLGVVWKPPYRIEASGALQPGENTIEVRVATLWVNRLIGDEHFPDDAEWLKAAHGTFLAEWPEWFLEDRPRPEPRRKAFSVSKPYGKDDALVPSGLLGPVTLQKAVR